MVPVAHGYEVHPKSRESVTWGVHKVDFRALGCYQTAGSYFSTERHFILRPGASRQSRPWRIHVLEAATQAPLHLD